MEKIAIISVCDISKVGVAQGSIFTLRHVGNQQARKNTSINVNMKFSQLVYKKF